MIEISSPLIAIRLRYLVTPPDTLLFISATISSSALKSIMQTIGSTRSAMIISMAFTKFIFVLPEYPPIITRPMHVRKMITILNLRLRPNTADVIIARSLISDAHINISNNTLIDAQTTESISLLFPYLFPKYAGSVYAFLYLLEYLIRRYDMRYHVNKTPRNKPAIIHAEPTPIR